MAAAVPPALDNPAVARIVRQAREHFFTHGYSQCTMDDLAAELGMSKKTLYVHFASKEAIMRAVIEQLGGEVRADADSLFANRSLSFAEKLHGFAEGMVRRLAVLDPRTLRDLQRFAPGLYALTVEMRQKNIPYIFGRFITEGQRAGKVRPDVDPIFAVEFFLHAMQGMVSPGTLDRLQLAPRDLLPRAIGLFFGGLLTPAGRKEHEKLFVR
ncbi:MAG TPA: TetR/AcrR family transcriptional regulator [Lacunisphaera sp.]|nr:TetR/AcrR family transcriptional regulator [Lacunisphaera sp.]